MRIKTPSVLTDLHWTHSNHQASLGACSMKDFHCDWDEIKKFRAPKKESTLHMGRNYSCCRGDDGYGAGLFVKAENLN